VHVSSDSLFSLSAVHFCSYCHYGKYEHVEEPLTHRISYFEIKDVHILRIGRYIFALWFLLTKPCHNRNLIYCHDFHFDAFVMLL
jgi:hypothetical protein